MRPDTLLKKVRKHTSQHEEAFREAEGRLAALTNEELTIQGAMADVLARMAIIRLDSPSLLSGQIAAEVAEREKEEAEARALLRVLEMDRDRLGDALHRAQEALEAAVTSVRASLAEDAAFQTATAELSRSQSALDTATQRNDRIRDECARKLPAFKAAALYQYLRGRQFGTSAYAGRGLAKRLDGWLASRINFAGNAASEAMLRDMQAMSGMQCEELEATLQLQASSLAGLEEDAMSAGGVPMRQAEQAGIQQKLDTLTKEATWMRESLLAYAANTDLRYRRIQEMLSKELGGQSLRDLSAQALTTPGQADDDLVNELGSLRVRLTALAHQAGPLKAEFAEAKAAHERAKRVEQTLSASDFRSNRYRYNSSLDVNSLLLGYMAGTLSESAVASRIRDERSVVYEPPEPSGGSDFSFGSSSSFGGGSSFSTSASTGGGGFRTSDSF